ncbi:hypothetical protein GCM10009749_23890 [Agromyces neolithicus]|uniref:Uncharacterized protein n=1 Tax=Agromyces neolithicus TaxID=269420 RepID=A0ABP4YGH4_9MICO
MHARTPERVAQTLEPRETVLHAWVGDARLMPPELPAEQAAFVEQSHLGARRECGLRRREAGRSAAQDRDVGHQRTSRSTRSPSTAWR